MLLLGTKNVASQTIEENGLINLGGIYRKYCKKNCNIPTFNFSYNSINLQQEGIYHITATFIVSATEPGDITIQLLNNGYAIPGAIATETITTAETEFRTMTIDYYLLAKENVIFNYVSNVNNSISFQNISTITATINNVVVNISKEI